MKSTVVPAQITTVEDKVAGNLGLSQLLLLIAPVFAGAGIYVVFPPLMSMAPYKVVIAVLMACMCGLLAIRIKGRILLLWAVILLRYNLRPRHYVFDKNDAHLRDMGLSMEESPEHAAVTEQHATQPIPRLSVAEAMQLENVLANPNADLHFLTDKKGALRVHFNEVK